MINNTDSKKVYKVQLGVTEYPIGFPFQSNPDGTPQLAVTVGVTYLQLNYNCKLSEDNGTLILIPTEEEAKTLVGPEDYSWMDKWVDAPLVITRDIPFVQESDYQVGRISPEQIEKDFDLSVMRDQILLDKIGEHTEDVSEEIESLHSYIDFVQQTHENDVAEIDAGITRNAVAIQKTRDDMNAEDGRLQTQITAQDAAITTNKNDIGKLGGRVTSIESKIPESASGTNHLITKQQLQEKETSIRNDMNQSDNKLQTQITAQTAKIATKQDKLAAGDNIIISGNVISATGGGAGLDFIVVEELPETGQKGIVYLIAKDGEAPDVYDEYVWITATDTFELIGSTKVDLSGYLQLSGGTMSGNLDIVGGKIRFGGSNQSSDDAFAPTIGWVRYGVMQIGDSTLYFDKSEHALHPSSSGIRTLGLSNFKWKNVYTQNINNGADLAVPTEGGTLARLEDLENIDALPDQTGNTGKFLKTDGTTASWEDVPPSVTITLKEYDE